MNRRANADAMRIRHEDHRASWTEDDWAGRARMARARLDAHGPDALDDLDRQALDLTDPTWSTP